MKMEIHYLEYEEKIAVVEARNEQEALEIFYSDLIEGNNKILVEIKTDG